jgi:hypothetical protein
LKFEPKMYVLFVIDIGYTTLSVYIYKCTREPNRALASVLWGSPHSWERDSMLENLILLVMNLVGIFPATGSGKKQVLGKQIQIKHIYFLFD